MGKSEGLKKRAQILLKKIKEEGVDEEICNEYVDDLEELKQDLLNNSQDWVDNLPDIDSVGGLFGVEEEIIDETMDKIGRQLGRILTRLGVDSEEENSIKKEHSVPPTAVHVYQQQSQGQTQQQSVNIISLIEEFEEEAKKNKPDKTKLNQIINKVLRYGKEFSPEILGLISRYFLI